VHLCGFHDDLPPDDTVLRHLLGKKQCVTTDTHLSEFTLLGFCLVLGRGTERIYFVDRISKCRRLSTCFKRTKGAAAAVIAGPATVFKSCLLTHEHFILSAGCSPNPRQV
jgi:hypothetical protein